MVGADCNTAQQRPSRPVQRPLSASDVEGICQRYASGASIDELARSYNVHRTTLITHLDRQGVPRRRVVRKRTDIQVTEGAASYLNGHSLATVAREFDVDARTSDRAFRRAGVAITPRRGSTS